MDMMWWLVVGVLVGIILVFIRMRHAKHKVFVILITIIILFIYITGSRLVSENKIDIKSLDGLVSAGKIYFSWLGHGIVNIKTIAGNAVNMDWTGNLTVEK